MYRILPAQFEHIPWLRLLYSRWMSETPYAYPEIDNEEVDNFVLALAKHLENNPNFCCLVATIGKKVVGFSAGEITYRAIGKPHVIGTQHWLYVVPKHRKRGVAKLLIAGGLRFMLQHNVEIVEFSEQVEQQGEWARRGFTPFHTRYYLPVSDIAANLSRLSPAPDPSSTDPSPDPLPADDKQLSLPFAS